jgi:hypothetical protein
MAIGPGVVEHYYRVCECASQYFNICRQEGPPSIVAAWGSLDCGANIVSWS